MSEQLLEVRDLRVVYESDEETVHAVNGISFSIGKQETLGPGGRDRCRQDYHGPERHGVDSKPAGKNGLRRDYL